MFDKKRIAEQERFNTLYPSIMRDNKIMYIGYLLQQAAQRLREHTALLYEDQAISYMQLYQRAVALSRLLLTKNIQPHDRVLLLIENSPEFYVGYFAILHVGAVVVPLNVFLKERELAHIITDANPSLIITASSFVPLLQATGITLPPVITEGSMPPADLGGDMPEFDVVALEPDAMAALLYTSGTTGLPKGVMLSSRTIMMNVLQGISHFDLRPQDRIFGVLPLFHSFAQNTCVWTPMFIGCTIILIRKIDRRHILQGVEQKPTIFLGVPALYGLMCLLKTVPIDSVRVFVSGGDALPDKIRSAFELIYRRKICSGYGLTEMSPFVSGELEEETVFAHNVGTPLIGIEYMVKDEQGKPVQPGAVGSLWLKGPNCMLGYYNEPEMTQAVLIDGWLNTGDLVYVDHKGRFIISGRLKDIIKHKGFIIYPPEIENVIMSYPSVIRVAVIGKLDVETGEVPVAYVQLRHDEPGIEKKLRDLCMKNLASYKVPREFFCTTHDLPMTATGKVDKKKLRAQMSA